MISCARFVRPVSPTKSESGMSSSLHAPVVRAGSVIVTSCSLTPVLKSPSGPKSTSLILNSDESKVHTSMWMCVMAVASICSEMNSIAANPRFE